MALEEALLYFIDATTAGDQLIVLTDTITALSSSFPIAKSTLTEVFFPRCLPRSLHLDLELLSTFGL